MPKKSSKPKVVYGRSEPQGLHVKLVNIEHNPSDSSIDKLRKAVVQLLNARHPYAIEVAVIRLRACERAVVRSAEAAAKKAAKVSS
jgi:hypothetical protein